MTTFHATRGFFAEQFLLELAAPVNTHTLCAVSAWLEGENTRARNNPLATTRKGHGGTPFNSAGVQNYPTFTAGMLATLETIRLKPYTKLLTEIRRGSSAHAIVREILASPWGTKSLPLDAVIADQKTYAAKRLVT